MTWPRAREGAAVVPESKASEGDSVRYVRRRGIVARAGEAGQGGDIVGDGGRGRY